MKNKKLMVLVIIFAIVIISIFSFNLLKSNKYSNDTIGSLAYNYTKNEEIVYLLEDGKYIPYIVLHNNYSNNSDTLLLRKNVIGNDEYYTGYNGSIMTEKLYKSHLEMSNFENYENTAVDNFLLNVFPQKFEQNFLNIINNTKLTLSLYNNGDYNNSTINRKFFILSFLELNTIDTWENQSANKTRLKYFENDNRRVAKNDAGITVVYWTRTYAWSGFGAVGLNGSIITETSSEAKYGVRPALTINSNTKIKKVYNQDYSKEIWILDI